MGFEWLGSVRGRIGACILVLLAVLLVVACHDEQAPTRTVHSALTRAGEELDFRRAWAPDPRSDVPLTYDVARSRVTMFGGAAPTLAIAPKRDLWERGAGPWLERTPPTGGPSARSSHALTYDESRQRTVLFGGAGNGNEVWEWDGAQWTGPLVATSAAPQARYQHALTYDPIRKRVLLFGGLAGSSSLADTWEWDGASWLERTPATGPSARYGAALTFDPVRGRAVLFGGQTAVGAYVGDTWEWDGTAWVQSAPVSDAPSARAGAGAAYDPVRARTVLYGGLAGAGALHDLWEWDGTTWTLAVQPALRPNGASGVGLTYDRARARLVLALGTQLGSGAPFAVWEWDGAAWAERSPSQTIPASRAGVGFVWHPQRSTLMLFGGRDNGAISFADFWEWTGLRWNQILPAGPKPGGRRQSPFAYDPMRNRLVMFGGLDQATALADTWEWDGTVWSQHATTGAHPAARGAHALFYDPTLQRTVLFAGGAPGVSFGDTWSWDGTTWTQLGPATAPSARANAAFAYDASRQRLVLFGGLDDAVYLDDTWEWNGSTWSAMAPQGGVAPSPRAVSGMTYDPDRQRSVLFGGLGDGGSVRDLWEWDGSTWTLHAPRDEWPTFIPDGAFGYDVANHHAVYFGGQSFDQGTGRETWLLSARGGACTSASDSTTGLCLDGIACESSTCGATCTSCDVPGDRGRCAAIVLAADPVSCAPALNGKSCDRHGECKVALGQPVQDASECGSGYLVDGVCCDVPSCGPCLTCDAAQKEIADNAGRCGTQRAGLDLRDDCATSDVASCGADGTCDGLGRCRNYLPDTACGPVDCVDNRATARTCGGAATCAPAATGTDCAPYLCAAGTGCATSCATDAECVSTHRCDTGTCVVKAEATCADAHTLVAPDGARTDCVGYKCVDSACKKTCESVNDCNDGFDCDQTQHCTASSDGSGDGSGCSCDAVGGGSTRTGAVAVIGLGLLLAWRRRSRRVLGVLGVLGVLSSAPFVACQTAPSTPTAHTTQALEPTFASADWSFAGMPEPRGAGGLAFDANRDRLVMYGGRNATSFLDDFWERDEDGWRYRDPGTQWPGLRYGQRMIYDPIRHVVLSYGGFVFGSVSSALWSWDGKAWVDRTPSAVPPGRYYMGATFDEARQKLVTFGGAGFAGTLGDTWEWDGQTWTERTPATGPGPRVATAMTYDAARQRTVLFGGYDDAVGYFGDTWTWDGQTWTDMTPAGAGPSARSLHDFMYDASRGVAVLYGGTNGAGEPTDVWEWNGATWHDATPAAGPTPASRRNPTMTYDSRRQEVRLYAGSHSGGTYTNDLWSWNGTRWLQDDDGTFSLPAARANDELAFDTDHQELLLFGGFDGSTYLGDLWAWTGKGWTPRTPTSGPAPAGRSGHGLAYDVGNHDLVLFGGEVGGDETWTWDGTTWTQHPGVGPSARRNLGLAYDAGRGRVVLFGGRTASTASAETWEWDGTSWQQRTATGPSARSGLALAYDASRQRTVLFGGTEASGQTLDRSVWEWDGTQWTEHAAPGGPAAQAAPALAYDPARHLVVVVVPASGSTYGEINETWEWNGETWHRQHTAHAPEMESAFGLGADVARGNLVLFGGFDATPSYTRRTWILSSYGTPCGTDADSTTGFCVDGVSCASRSCLGTCEACNTEDSRGRCAPVVSADDPDTCGAAQGSTCDRTGACKTGLGTAATDAAQCASGFLVDGVCCNESSCGACRTCDSAKKEIADNPGFCGTARRDTDPKDDCAATDATTCGTDGTCDGRGACTLHVAGVACGPATCIDNRSAARACDGAGTCSGESVATACAPYTCLEVTGCSTSCATDTDCVSTHRCEAGSCVSREDSSCDGDHTLRAPDGRATDCGAYRCEGATCKSRCSNAQDCTNGYDCSSAGECVLPTDSSADAGCSCHEAPGAPQVGSWALMVLALLLVRRRR